MDEPLVSVAGLHALAYCERLYYLEEVERIRVADAAVFAGRRLHEEIGANADEGKWDRRSFASERLGIQGTVDVLARRDGRLIPYEHKRGRSAGKKGAREAWQTDRIQVGAYALLIGEQDGTPIVEARVRYHADGVTVQVMIDELLRAEVSASVARARELRRTLSRPPVTQNERLCVRCSLAPVCLPEEARRAADPGFEPIRLLPDHARGKSVHVADHGARIGKSGDELVIELLEGPETRLPVAEVGQIVIYGFSQISAQALRVCADHGIGVHWVTASGGLVGSFSVDGASAQRHLRQFRALDDPKMAFGLARLVVLAKLQGQLRYLLRATRGAMRSDPVRDVVRDLRTALRGAARATDVAVLRGQEGAGALAYFGGVRTLLRDDIDPRLRFGVRSRRPPADRFNALLGFGYSMLYRETLLAIHAVGLHPGFGFFHEPQTGGYPLALDLMELFRVPLVDMAVVAAVNRNTFHPDTDFRDLGGQVLLSDAGRVKAIEVFERRKTDSWLHSAVGYSLEYGRIVELEARLLEKEWMGEGGLFARFRIR